MKKMYKLFMGAAVLAVLGVTAFGQKPVAVINGGWEDGLGETHGAYGGWFYDSNDGAVTTYEVIQSDVEEGLNSLYVQTTDSGSNEWSSQIYNRSWSVDSAKAYRLSMWFKNPESALMRASFTSGHGRTYAEYGRIDKRIVPSEWTKWILFIQVPFTTDTIKAEPDYISMSTHFINANAKCLVDDFEVFEEVADMAVNEAGDMVTLTFMDDILTLPSGAENAFVVFIGDNEDLVTAAEIDGSDAKILNLTLETALTADDDAEIEFSGQVLKSEVNAGDTATLAAFGMPLPKPGVGTGITKTNYSPISFYPNPATDVITFENDFIITKVQFFDITGKAVKTVEGSSINSINVTDLNKGLYFLMINSENGKNYSGRLLVE